MLLLSTTALVAAALAPAYGDDYTGTMQTSGPFPTGIYNFYDNSVLRAGMENTIPRSAGLKMHFHDHSTVNVSAAHAINGGTPLDLLAGGGMLLADFHDFSTLNITAEYGVAGGVLDFYDNSKVNANVPNVIAGGLTDVIWTFHDDIVFNASIANAISGGFAVFMDASTLNASVENAVSGGWVEFEGGTLNASATNAVTAGVYSFAGTLNISAANAMGTDPMIEFLGTLNAKAANSISGGKIVFRHEGTLNASAENAITGGEQDFINGSILNASAKNAITGGLQRFDLSTLQAMAANAINGGAQEFWSYSRLYAGAGDALSGGTQTFLNFSVLEAATADAVNGGTQSFLDSSELDAQAGNAVAGGTQNFSNNSSLNATAANAVSGGNQNFHDATFLNASVAGAVGGGSQVFSVASVLNASAGNAVAGGNQYFDGFSRLDASAELAINGGIQTFAGNSILNVLFENALSTTTDVRFDNTSGDIGGTLDLNGYNTTIGRISSEADGSGAIVNGDAGNSTLTVDTSRAPSTFSGTIKDGGSGTLGLALAGGHLTLSGANTYSGGTTVENGTLQLGADNALGMGDLDTANAGILDLAGHTQSVATLTGEAGSVITTSGAGTGSVLNVEAGTFSGDINNGSGGVDLVKQGLGTLTLNGTGSQSAETHVLGGTLIVGDDAHHDASLASPVFVANGARLGGHGTVGATVVDDGGMLAPGASIGMLTVDGDLKLAQGSVLDFEFGAPGTSTAPDDGDSDSVHVNGNLELGGATLNVTDAGGFGPGVYRLFDYTGSLSETNGGIIVGSAPVPASSLIIQRLLADKRIDLVNVDGLTLNFWNANGLASVTQRGGGSGIWSNNSSVWTDAAATVTAAMHPLPGFAIFAGDAGVVTIDGAAGTSPVETTGMQFAVDGYHLEGDTLTLVADADHVAPVEIRVGDGGAGAEDWMARIDNVIAGSDGLRKTGAGTLVLTGANSFTGGTHIDAGTLSVSSNTSLGDASGALVFNGGTLEVAGTGFTTTDRSIALGDHGGGFEIADAGNIFTLSGDIAGGGALAKEGAGTLVLTGANSYTGGTLVQSGTLVGDAGSIRGDLGNAGRVVFDQAVNGTFAGAVAGLNGVYGEMVKAGAGELTLAGTSSLDWTVDAGGLVSAAERFTGDVEIGSAGSFIFNQSVDAAYKGTLSGTGAFNKTGARALAYDGDGSGFTGTTAVEAGSLIVGSDATHGDAVLGGPVDVLSGALLGGHGTVGAVTLATGATIAPGNSIGTLNVAGDITFDAGSFYEVEVDPASSDSDLIHATGTATLNGASVVHIGADGTYKPISTYTILTADAGINGMFGTVSSDFAFFDPQLWRDADSVYLKLIRNNVDFGAIGETPNQHSIGDGIDPLGYGNPIWDAVGSLNEEDARSAFDQLSGEVHASLKGVLIDDSHFVRDAATDRIRAAFGAVGADNTPVLAYGEDGTMLASADTLSTASWGRAFGAWSDLDGDGNAASLSSSTGGFLTGIDAALSQNWRLGILAGYSHTTFDVDDRSSSGSSQNWHLGLYGGGQWDVGGGTLGLRGGAAYTWHDIETARSVAFPGFSDSLSGDYSAGTAQVFGEIAYDIKAGSIGLEPFANLAYVNLNTDGFTEKGGAVALTSASTNTDVTFATLGLRASTSFTLGTVEATARGMLGWRHTYGDTTPLSSFAFAGSAPFSIAGIPIAKDAALIEVGLDLALSRNATFGLSYQGQFASGVSQNGFNATLNVKF